MGAKRYIEPAPDKLILITPLKFSVLEVSSPLLYLFRTCYEVIEKFTAFKELNKC